MHFVWRKAARLFYLTDTTNQVELVPFQDDRKKYSILYYQSRCLIKLDYIGLDSFAYCLELLTSIGNFFGVV